MRVRPHELGVYIYTFMCMCISLVLWGCSADYQKETSV